MKTLKWIFPIALTAAALALSPSFESWIAMWMIAFALFFSAKWVTAFNYFGVGITNRLVAYFFIWPGMDATRFFANDDFERPNLREAIPPLTKTLCGIALLFIALHLETHPLLKGWLGMIGLTSILHFGLFHLLSIFWRRQGINAQPIMLRPALSTSLADFWGKRWNAAFTILMQRTCLRPLGRHVGRVGAFLGVFVISGFIHELVLSVPARAAYGLPTAYFVLQGLGALAERTCTARRLGIGRGLVGWLYVVLIAGLPAYFLFPPPFIHNVILPMLNRL